MQSAAAATEQKEKPDIDSVKGRAALEPRREPYWGPRLDEGRYLGFRKIDAQRGSWIARMRNEEGHQIYGALGKLSPAFGYTQAIKAAQAWFKQQDAGVIAKGRYTVEDACKAYVEDRRKKKGESCAADAEWRFKKSVYGTAFGRTEVKSLRSVTIEKWREGLGITPAGQNRMMTSLRAALNLAVNDDYVESSRAWRKVKQHQGADRRRDNYLDLAQRRALLGATKGAVHDLIEAVMLIGARPGEIARATRGQFDARRKLLKLIKYKGGKRVERDVPLDPVALAFFERVSKDKLPAAPLLARDDGDYFYGTEWTDAVSSAAKAAGLPEGTCLYDCRHSFITSAITDGLSVLEVARLTGTSLQMIDKHYGHLVGDVAQRLALVQRL